MVMELAQDYTGADLHSDFQCSFCHAVFSTEERTKKHYHVTRNHRILANLPALPKFFKVTSVHLPNAPTHPSNACPCEGTNKWMNQFSIYSLTWGKGGFIYLF